MVKTFKLDPVLFQLISSVDPKFLKLTKLDDKIYSTFRESFKDLDVKVLTHDQLKSDTAKERWRPFCNQFEGLVEDFNFGTLLRLDCEKDYVEDNTVFGEFLFCCFHVFREQEPKIINSFCLQPPESSSSPSRSPETEKDSTTRCTCPTDPRARLHRNQPGPLRTAEEPSENQ
uniref:Polysaccharide biosynthesis domain containing 1 n=1 Tax=Acanthochromis polyacanthus TaxID=80966 RepID=A0A3Q1HNW8_9TELE